MAYQQQSYYRQETGEYAPQHQQQSNVYHHPSVRHAQQPSSIQRQDSVAHPTWQSTTSSHPETMSSMSSPPPKTPISEYGGASEYPRTPRSHTGTTAMLYPRRPPQEKKRICGLKRQTFYILLAVTLFFLVVAIATGLGVGLALSKNLSSSSTAGDTSPVNSTSPTSVTRTVATTSQATNTLITSTGSIAVATPTGTVTEAPVICPGANNTDYISTYKKLFEIQCGRDYAKKGGAIDQNSVSNVASFAACIDLCATIQDCMGVGYGSYEGVWTCFPKSQLGDPNWSSDWSFAVYQEPQPPS